MTDQDQATRTARARTGRWAIGRIANGQYRVLNLNNGSATYTVTREGDGWACTCPDQGRRGGRCKHIEAVRLTLDGETLDIHPLVRTDDSGIHATYADGARISLTVGGRTACSNCGYRRCEHFRAAVPFYKVWLQDQAASGRWPAWKMAQLGVG